MEIFIKKIGKFCLLLDNENLKKPGAIGGGVFMIFYLRDFHILRYPFVMIFLFVYLIFFAFYNSPFDEIIFCLHDSPLLHLPYL